MCFYGLCVCIVRKDDMIAKNEQVKIRFRYMCGQCETTILSATLRIIYYGILVFYQCEFSDVFSLQLNIMYIHLMFADGT